MVPEPAAAQQVAHESAALLNGQNQVLERIARGAPLHETLDLLIRVIEAQSPDVFGSILLLDADGRHMRHGAGPRLPPSFVHAIEGEPIGPRAGSCGTAAYRREQVIVEDIARDPLWDDYRPIALENGLRACWSTPVFDSQGRVLATFALYFPTPRRPTNQHHSLIAISTHIAAIAITRHQESEAIRASEERYRQLVELSPDAIHIHQHYKLVFVNEGCLKLFGASSPEQLLGRSLLEFIHPEQREMVRERMRVQYTEMRTIPGMKQTALRLDGTVVDVDVKSAPFSFDGKPAIQTVVRDMTERNRAERELREAEDRYRKLVELSPDAIHIHQDYKFVFVNKACVALLGATKPEQLLGHSLLEFLVPEQHEEVRERLRIQYEEMRFIPSSQQKALRLDGTVVDVDVKSAPFSFEGKPAIQTVVRDMTERNRAERELREAEDRYRRLVELSPEPIFVHADLKFVYVNHAFVTLMGASCADELFGKDLLDYVLPEYHEQVRERVRLIEQDQIPPVIEQV